MSMDKTVFSLQCEFVHSNEVKNTYIDQSTCTVILLQLRTIINFKIAVSDFLQTFSPDVIFFVVLRNHD